MCRVRHTKSKNASAALSIQNVSQLGGQAIAFSVAGQLFYSIAVRNLRSVMSGQNFLEHDISKAMLGASKQSAGASAWSVALGGHRGSCDSHAKRVRTNSCGWTLLLSALCMKRECSVATPTILPVSKRSTTTCNALPRLLAADFTNFAGGQFECRRKDILPCNLVTGQAAGFVHI